MPYFIVKLIRLELRQATTTQVPARAAAIENRAYFHEMYVT